MTNDERSLVEAPALEQLKGLGWRHLNGTALAPASSNHRASLKEVVLTPNLEQAIQRINPWISEENLRKVVREVTRIRAATLMEANRWFWERLTQYFSVDQDLGRGRKGQTVKLMDFDAPEKNEFLCVDQFRVQGPAQPIVPDITLFVNGLPLGVMECKSPTVTNPMGEGIDQLRRYANLRRRGATEGCERLFHYNQVMIATHGEGARFGDIFPPVEHYLEWKDPYPLDRKDLGESPTAQQVLIQGLLAPGNFLDLVQNFTVFETPKGDGGIVKKVARYQQFRAVRKTVARLKAQADRRSKGAWSGTPRGRASPSPWCSSPARSGGIRPCGTTSSSSWWTAPNWTSN